MARGYTPKPQFADGLAGVTSRLMQNTFWSSELTHEQKTSL